jgi:AraC family transcriptional regulator of adaptative response/methylated-DNA-[protein]-cysteine methyltransferase
MTPAGRAVTADYIITAVIKTPLGDMLAGATSDAICLLEFDDRGRLERQLKTIRELFNMPLLRGEHALFDRLRQQLSQYFEGKRTVFDIPMAYPGTDFQRRVWQALRDIPYGQTRSYREVARVIGKPGAARAVGGANGSNRIAIVIPCHRVIAAGGGPGGYGGGLGRKLSLLELERNRER